VFCPAVPFSGGVIEETARSGALVTALRMALVDVKLSAKRAKRPKDTPVKAPKLPVEEVNVTTG
jgi:hypothetical protein